MLAYSISDAQIIQARLLFAAGHDVHYVAGLLGVKLYTAEQVRKGRKTQQELRSPEMHAAVVAARRKGLTQVEIADRLGVHENYVYRHLLRERCDASRPRIVPEYRCDGCERKVWLSPCQVCRALEAKPNGVKDAQLVPG